MHLDLEFRSMMMIIIELFHLPGNIYIRIFRLISNQDNNNIMFKKIDPPQPSFPQVFMLIFLPVSNVGDFI